MNKQQPGFRLDWVTTLIPLAAILTLCLLFLLFPESSAGIVASIRFFLGDQLGSYYLILGLGIFFCSLYIAFSPYGTIKLGGKEKPDYSPFQWGAMMFTSGLAADILFYSLCEWMLYANEPHITELGSMQDWASTFPLFHWGPIPWCFYLVLAVAFGFMLHVRKRTKQKYSEACRPLLGRKVDGFSGRLIDLCAVFALLAGTATTFSLATPLLSSAISRVFSIPQSHFLTIGILMVIGITYTVTVYFGMKGIAKLATSCTYLFFALLAYVFIGGGQDFEQSLILKDLQPGRMLPAHPPSLRTGRFFTGPTGWYGVWQPRFLSVPSAADGQLNRPFWEDISGDYPEPLPLLSSWAITVLDLRYRKKPPFWNFTLPPRTYTRPS